MSHTQNSLIRLNKKISNSGFCSRRDADKLILGEQVFVNGAMVNNPATKVTNNDVININGEIIKNDHSIRVWVYHKPSGLIVTHKDTEGRNTVFDMLPETLPRVISIGRLDITSEGLLLLTNSPVFANILELPKNQFIRVYKVRVFGKVDKKKLNMISSGVIIEGIQYKKNIIEITKNSGKNSWLKISIFEGKNREVRKLMEYIGLKVNRLIRIQYGPYFLDSLPRGEVQEVGIAKEIEKYL